MPIPLTPGTAYDGRTIVELTEVEPNDTYQPYQYELSDGEFVWIPLDDEAYANQQDGTTLSKALRLIHQAVQATPMILLAMRDFLESINYVPDNE